MIEVYNLKGKKVKVSKKMYDHVYKNRGFKLVEETETEEDAIEEDETEETEIEDDTEKIEEINIEEITKQEIMDMLDEKEIEYNARMTKKELLELM